MNRENDKDRDCTLESENCEFEESICCCYITDEDGQYEDPCHTPIEEMCCC